MQHCQPRHSGPPKEPDEEGDDPDPGVTNFVHLTESMEPGEGEFKDDGDTRK